MKHLVEKVSASTVLPSDHSGIDVLSMAAGKPAFTQQVYPSRLDTARASIDFLNEGETSDAASRAILFKHVIVTFVEKGIISIEDFHGQFQKEIEVELRRRATQGF